MYVSQGFRLARLQCMFHKGLGLNVCNKGLGLNVCIKGLWKLPVRRNAREGRLMVEQTKTTVLQRAGDPDYRRVQTFGASYMLAGKETRKKRQQEKERTSWSAIPSPVPLICETTLAPPRARSPRWTVVTGGCGETKH